MGWIESLFKAIAEGLGLARQTQDPEVIRQKKIREIEAQLEKARNERDRNMSIKRTPENELSLGNDLGVITNNIIMYRQTIETLKR